MQCICRLWFSRVRSVVTWVLRLKLIRTSRAVPNFAGSNFFPQCAKKLPATKNHSVKNFLHLRNYTWKHHDRIWLLSFISNVSFVQNEVSYNGRYCDSIRCKKVAQYNWVIPFFIRTLPMEGITWLCRN